MCNMVGCNTADVRRHVGSVPTQRKEVAVTERYLPDVYREMRQRFPDVAQSLDALGKAVATAGPLDEKTQRLVNLGIATGAQAEGAVRSHCRRALDAGASPEELFQVVMLTISTRGFPAAVAAYSWMQEVLGPEATADDAS